MNQDMYISFRQDCAEGSAVVERAFYLPVQVGRSSKSESRAPCPASPLIPAAPDNGFNHPKLMKIDLARGKYLALPISAFYALT